MALDILHSQPKDIVLVGTGKMSEVISVYLEEFSELTIVGYTVDRCFYGDPTFRKRPLVPWDELASHFPPDQVRLLGPLTYQRLNSIRRDRYLEAKNCGYQFASFLHPDNHIMTNDIGDNCIVLENNTIQPFCRIGSNTILWSSNHIGHHSTIGSHCFIASQVGIAGNCTIGDECHISGQVGIVHGVKIGNRCALLNAAGVSRDLPDDSVIVGQQSDIKPYPSSRIIHLI